MSKNTGFSIIVIVIISVVFKKIKIRDKPKKDIRKHYEKTIIYSL